MSTGSIIPEREWFVNLFFQSIHLAVQGAMTCCHAKISRKVAGNCGGTQVPPHPLLLTPDSELALPGTYHTRRQGAKNH